jgi:hypothetical protein
MHELCPDEQQNDIQTKSNNNFGKNKLVNGSARHMLMLKLTKMTPTRLFA